MTDTPNVYGQSRVLKAAEQAVLDRGPKYGHPMDNHQTTALLFVDYLYRKYGIHVPLEAEDTCMFNIFQKISRDANTPDEDNLTDIVGYVVNLEMVRNERRNGE